jgi:signal transduction histidine kinase
MRPAVITPPRPTAEVVTAADALERLGPWLFASVALVLVALLAWQLGRWVGLREGRAQARKRLDRTDRSPRPSIAAAVPLAATPSSARTTTLPATPPPVAAAVNQGSTASISANPSPDSEAQAFAYAMSHDLRAPLRVVEGFARILKEDYGRQLDRIGNDHLDRLLGAATRMHTMIEGMITLAQLSHVPLQREAVQLSQLAGFILDDLRRGQPNRHAEVSIQPDIWAEGDPTQLRQVLENLLGNAWKYSQRASPSRISFAARQVNGIPVFEVADNGAGFDMRTSGKLFGLFQRLHGQSDFPGTGLGLASVQRIVKRHGGQVWAEAEPGRGARFYFTLQGSPGLPPPQ